MSRSAGLILVAALVFAAAPAVAQQDIHVSKKVKNFNFNPRAAVNPTNGDVLVTWTEIKPGDSSYSQVWAALLQRKNGTFKLRKARRVSPSAGYHGNARPTWVPANKEYLVVWDTRRVATEPSDVLGRVVNKKGKPKGSALTLVGDGNTNYGPVPVLGSSGDVERVNYARNAPARSTAAVSAQYLEQLVQDYLPLANPGLIVTREAEFTGIEESLSFEECSLLFVQEGLPPDSSVHLLLVRDGAAVAALDFPGSRMFLGNLNSAFGNGSVHNYEPAAERARWFSFEISDDCTHLRLKGDPIVEFEGDSAALFGAAPVELRVRRREPAAQRLEQFTTAWADGTTTYQGSSADDGTTGPAAELFDHGGRLRDLRLDRVADDDSPFRLGADDVDMLLLWVAGGAGTSQEIHAHLFTAR